MSPDHEWSRWEALFEQFLRRRDAAFDAAHDLAHVQRVVASARALARAEQADLAVVVPAAWLHDCVSVPKDSPQRAAASRLAGEVAVEYLQAVDYPAHYLPAIRHAIEAHSFSANIEPRTREARVLQDADRLDALGAIGIARCLMLSAELGRRLYDPQEPFPQWRTPDDAMNAIDHFYLKLFRIADHMTTQAGRDEARRRTAFMRAFLDQLSHELPPAPEDAP